VQIWTIRDLSSNPSDRVEHLVLNANTMLHFAHGKKDITGLLGPKSAQHVLLARLLCGGKVLALVFHDEQPTIGEASDEVGIEAVLDARQPEAGWVFGDVPHPQINLLQTVERPRTLKLFAAEIAKLEIALMAMATTNLRVVSAAAEGQAPGVESSMLKIKGTVIRQEINHLTRAACGPYAMPFVSEALEQGSNVEAVGPDYAMPATADYFNNRKLSIYGGSNEVQKQIIAKTMLEV